MAKNSIKSKGFRKSTKKKPYLTRREILTAAVIAAVVLIVIVLFRVFYSDGSLKVSDGKVQTDSPFSLVINDGTGRKPRYFKIGQLAEIDGYTLSGEAAAGDENVRVFTYVPNGESAVDRITCTPYSFEAPTFADAMLASYVSAENMDCSEMQKAALDGHDVQFFTLRSNRPAEGETAFVQLANAYISVGERCISVSVRNDADSADGFIEDSEMTEIMHRALAALSFEAK